ncbi:MAG: type III pantothenate kinase [Chitinophagales bacterium]|nr:type III pantothenate kinase [Chitinophagales bacterium]MDW8427103.1 type III pantothenate kinase [Chitinophagales bacterium]
MLLCVDIGNTRIKAGVFKGRRLLATWVGSLKELKALGRLVRSYPVTHLICATVQQECSWLRQLLPASVRWLQVNHRLRLNFENRYSTPHTLGADRMANLAGARLLFPDQTLLVVSAGSCITYDVLQADGIFYGGSITPGIQMRLRAEYEFTDKLPLVMARPTKALLGKDTRRALLTGAYNGARFELQGYIEALRHRHNQLTVVLTGGDAAELKGTKSKWRGCRIFVRRHLSLLGLNEIARLNGSAFST